MKKIISILLTLVLALVLAFSFATVAYADGGTSATQLSWIDRGADIIQTLFLTGIGILGTWVSLKLSASTRLKNVNVAWDNAVKAAQLTVGELKQTLVDGMKAAHEDGKLTKPEITKLNEALFEKAKEKMSQPAYDILLAAGVDVNALILGAGESCLEEIKRNSLSGLLGEPIKE